MTSLAAIPGDGVLARNGDLVLVCSGSDRSGSTVDAVLVTLQRVGSEGGDGGALADQLGTALSGGGVDMVAFGPSEHGLVVVVFGRAYASVSTEHGEQRLAITEANKGVRSLVPGAVREIRAGLGDAASAGPALRWCDLQSGSMRADGLVLTSGVAPPDGARNAQTAWPPPPSISDAADAAPAPPLEAAARAAALATPTAALALSPEPSSAEADQLTWDSAPAESAQPEPEPAHSEPARSEPARSEPESVASSKPRPGGESGPDETTASLPAAEAETDFGAPSSGAAAYADTAPPTYSAPVDDHRRDQPHYEQPRDNQPRYDHPPPLGAPVADPYSASLTGPVAEAAGPPSLPIAKSDVAVNREQPFNSVVLFGARAPTSPEVRDPLPVASKPPEPEAGLPIPVDPATVSGAEVLGVYCKNGHFDDPAARYCAICGISMVQQTLLPRRGPRPPLGVLILDDGSIFSLDSDYVIGRDPSRDEDVASGSARPLRIDDVEGLLSRVHARIHLDGWQVQVVDLGSANGTGIWGPHDAAWQQAPTRQAVPLRPGTQVGIGRRQLRYESHRNT